jgi:hypothetical protein
MNEFLLCEELERKESPDEDHLALPLTRDE